MNTSADLLVYDRDHRMQLVVEVKSRRNASAQWATELRRNLLSHGMIPRAPYFLLALPKSFYLWKDADAIERMPDYEIDATEALGAYIGGHGLSLDDISKYGFELLIFSWLKELMNSDLSAETVDPGLRWLFDSGLYDTIKHGSMASEAAV